MTTSREYVSAAQALCPRCRLSVDPTRACCDHCGARLGPGAPTPWWHLHRRLYDWTLAWAYRPSATLALCLISLTESIIFPVPPDVLLAPLTLGTPRKWIRYAGLCTLASVLGAVAAYAIGAGAWELVDDFFFRYVPGFTPRIYQDASRLYDRWNFWVVFTAGFTPLPFKVFNVVGGACRVNLWGFLAAAVVSRAARFFLVAGLMRLYGPRVTPFIDRYFNWLALLFTMLLIGGFIAIKYAT